MITIFTTDYDYSDIKENTLDVSAASERFAKEHGIDAYFDGERLWLNDGETTIVYHENDLLAYLGY